MPPETVITPMLRLPLGLLHANQPNEENRMKKRLLLTGLVMALGAGSALAQVKPEIMVKQRQAAMTLQGKYLGPMAAMAQGKAPFRADVVAYNASLLDALSRMPWD